MKPVIYSVEATDDLDGIYDYSVEQWGAVQADRYVVAIRDRIARLATGEMAHLSADEVQPGLRRALAGQPVVFFREDDAAVTVVRVLHQRMDMGRV